MNWDRVQGNWRHLKGKFKEQWSVLSDNQLDVIAGNRERLLDMLQESYGISRDEAERQVRQWENSEQRAAAFEQVLRRCGEFV